MNLTDYFCVSNGNHAKASETGSTQGKHQPEIGSGLDTFKYFINTI
jgi:hypothetical protein